MMFKNIYYKFGSGGSTDIAIKSEKASSFLLNLKIFGADPETLKSKHDIYHPNPPNTRYAKNGMSRDRFEMKNSIEKPYYDVRENKKFDLDVSNYAYWGEDRVVASYKAIRQVSLKIETPILVK